MTDHIDWLYGLQFHGVKLGLQGIRKLLTGLDHPERAFPIALVGGTNGKGSVSAMLDAMLLASGRKTGLYTSPHLVRPHERIRIAGEDIASTSFERALGAVREIGSTGEPPSFFEVMTSAALLAFRDVGVEAAVLEVGLGGRLDATNAADPLVSTIVTIDFDHMGTLGTTLAAIATEKSGIIRANRPLISGVSQPEAIAVLRERCDALQATLIDARSTELPDGATLSLEGSHQRDNARVAIATFREFTRAIGFSCDPRAISQGLETTRWPGRLQLVAGRPSILLDGAHNVAGAVALAKHLALRGGPRPVLLFGAMADKDIAGILAPLTPHVTAIVTATPGVLRAATSDDLAVAARKIGVVTVEGGEPARALQTARALAGPDGLVLVSGSLYLVGEVAAILEGGAMPGPVSM